MILGKIVAGALALVWDIESAFVSVNLGQANFNRAANTCSAISGNATLTGCGQTLSDALVNLVTGGINVLNGLVAGLSITGNVR